MIPAIILAAGLGRRIAARTRGGPKALLELHGMTLLERALRGLGAAGFGEVVLVTGHGAAAIRTEIPRAPSGIEVLERWNADYATSNNIVSLLAARDDARDGFCLLNSDIVFDPSILVELARLDQGNWVVVDGDEPLGEEEMKVEVDGDGVVRRISKGLDPGRSAGEYIGICRFDARGAARLMESAGALVRTGGTHLYYEDAMDAAADDLAIRPAWTRNRAWTEVDDDEDYERALQVAAGLDRRA